MAKKIKTVVKLQCPAGKANPAPPVGPALGQHGVNIMDFCTKFNQATKDKGDTVIPVEISIYEDRTFDFILKQPPVAILIKHAAKISKGSGKTPKEKVGSISASDVTKIAQQKMPDLQANSLEAAERIVIGTARSMGVDVK